MPDSLRSMQQTVQSMKRGEVPWEVCETFNEGEWRAFSFCSNIPERVIRRYSDRFEWAGLCRHSQLPEQLMEENIDRLHWGFVERCQEMSLGFILRWMDKFNINALFYHKERECAEIILKEYCEQINWEMYGQRILRRQNLSEEFVVELKMRGYL